MAAEQDVVSIVRMTGLAPVAAEVVAYDTGPAAPVEAPAVLLLHGIGMSHLTWAEVQPALRHRVRTIALDLPGFGRAGKPARGFGVPDFAQAAGAALDRLGISRWIAVGHSMGCQVAVELAVRRTRQAAGLVLVGPVVDSTRRALLTQARDLARDALREPAGVDLRMLTDYLKGGPRWFLQSLGPMLDYPIETRLGQAGCPVTVVRGARDPIAREAWCRRLAAAASSGAEVVTVPGGAHVVPLTAPDAIQQAVGRLVARALNRAAGEPG